MALRTMTYLDIPVEIRRQAAGRSRTNLRALLANPAYTMDQRLEIVSQIERLSIWEAGMIPIDGVPPPEPSSTANGLAQIKFV